MYLLSNRAHDCAIDHKHGMNHYFYMLHNNSYTLWSEYASYAFSVSLLRDQLPLSFVFRFYKSVIIYLQYHCNEVYRSLSYILITASSCLKIRFHMYYCDFFSFAYHLVNHHSIFPIYIPATQHVGKITC